MGEVGAGEAYGDAADRLSVWSAGRSGGWLIVQGLPPVEEWRKADLARWSVFAREIATCIGDVPLAQHEFDAFASLAYNIGAPAFCGSTLVKRLQATPPDYPGACAQILRWTYAGGKVEPGLLARRKTEYRQCMGAAQ